MSTSLTFTTISNRELDRVVYQIKTAHPHDGERLLAGHLVSQGIIVPRSQLRSSIHRVDPVNTVLRRSLVTRRRVYFSEGPNYVWHVDGNHKLIRWRMVIHGGVDGYSRTVVYLACSHNNRATTVFTAFEEAVAMYGLPTRVRSDLGGENVDIWTYMVEQHGSESAVITGSSTHNERIERLWRDVFCSVGAVFYELFYELEANGQLDPLNEVDLFCLHWVYIPKVNKCLQQFTESWNNHSLSSEGNQTPNQLFISGILAPEQQHGPQTRQPTSPLPIPTPAQRVVVPCSHFHACNALKQVLQLTVQPSHVTSKAEFTQVAEIVGSHINAGCTQCV